uniref:Uncharacterized protein orf488 n=1 Tax=Nyctotherus ovalis TaxID=70075 RepID=F1AAL0_NYCOV|nr:hypothetical protein [Nyctotherus ovalis]
MYKRYTNSAVVAGYLTAYAPRSAIQGTQYNWRRKLAWVCNSGIISTSIRFAKTILRPLRLTSTLQLRTLATCAGLQKITVRQHTSGVVASTVVQNKDIQYLVTRPTLSGIRKRRHYFVQHARVRHDVADKYQLRLAKRTPQLVVVRYRRLFYTRHNYNLFYLRSFAPKRHGILLRLMGRIIKRNRAQYITRTRKYRRYPYIGRSAIVTSARWWTLQTYSRGPQTTVELSTASDVRIFINTVALSSSKSILAQAIAYLFDQPLQARQPLYVTIQLTTSALYLTILKNIIVHYFATIHVSLKQLQIDFNLLANMRGGIAGTLQEGWPTDALWTRWIKLRRRHTRFRRKDYLESVTIKELIRRRNLAEERGTMPSGQFRRFARAHMQWYRYLVPAGQLLQKCHNIMSGQQFTATPITRDYIWAHRTYLLRFVNLRNFFKPLRLATFIFELFSQGALYRKAALSKNIPRYLYKICQAIDSLAIGHFGHTPCT